MTNWLNVVILALFGKLRSEDDMERWLYIWSKLEHYWSIQLECIGALGSGPIIVSSDHLDELTPPWRTPRGQPDLEFHGSRTGVKGRTKKFITAPWVLAMLYSRLRRSNGEVTSSHWWSCR